MPGPVLTRRYLIGGALASCMLPTASLMPTRAWADQDPDDPFQIPSFDEKKLPKDFRRAVVPYPTRHWPGTVIINTQARQLFVVLEGQQAMRFGCAVGRDGFSTPHSRCGWKASIITQRCGSMNSFLENMRAIRIPLNSRSGRCSTRTSRIC